MGFFGFGSKKKKDEKITRKIDKNGTTIKNNDTSLGKKVGHGASSAIKNRKNIRKSLLQEL